jgi:hypothetical protein
MQTQLVCVVGRRLIDNPSLTTARKLYHYLTSTIIHCNKSAKMWLQVKLSSSRSDENFGFIKIWLSTPYSRTTNVFSRLSRSWIWIKIRLTDFIQSSLTSFGYAVLAICPGGIRQKLVLGGVVHKIIIWRFSFSRFLSYKTSESVESSQGMMGHT